MEDIMKSLKEQIDNYSINHQNRSNLIAHYIGIPAIMIGILLLLNWFTISFALNWHLTFSWIAVILTLVYYFRLNIKLACLMTIILVILNLICYWIAYPKPTSGSFILFLVLFVGGWLLQFLGHAFEKTKPAFFASLMQLLIAPLFLLVELLKALHCEKFFDLEPSTKSKTK
jgi:uncharacterized membrane protein YGL010W